MAAIRLWEHRKLKILMLRLGLPRPHAIGLLECLAHYVALYHPTGDISKLTDEEIEVAAAEWTGEPGAFLRAAIEVGFIDRDEAGTRLHDWQDWCPAWVRRKSRQADEFADADVDDPPRRASDNHGAPKRAVVDQSAPKRALVDQSAPKRALVDQSAPKRALVDQSAPKRALVDQSAPKRAKALLEQEQEQEQEQEIEQERCAALQQQQRVASPRFKGGRDALAIACRKYGLSAKQTDRLIRSHGEDRVLELCRWAAAKRAVRTLRNGPAAWIQAAARGDYEEPDEYADWEAKQLAELDATRERMRSRPYAAELAAALATLDAIPQDDRAAVLAQAAATWQAAHPLVPYDWPEFWNDVLADPIAAWAVAETWRQRSRDRPADVGGPQTT